eukprot:1159384-Pelagomonas_calceolata.AAC.2
MLQLKRENDAVERVEFSPAAYNALWRGSPRLAQDILTFAHGQMQNDLDSETHMLCLRGMQAEEDLLCSNLSISTYVWPLTAKKQY